MKINEFGLGDEEALNLPTAFPSCHSGKAFRTAPLAESFPESLILWSKYRLASSMAFSMLSS